jgi:signal transduction protein with GAF and PtsI domain
MVVLGDALGTALRPAALADELARVVADIRLLFSAAACSCARVDGTGETLRFVAADGEGAEDIVGVELPIHRGIAGWVATSGQPIVTSELSQDSRFARDVAEATNYVPETIMAAPVVSSDGNIVGVIEVLDPGARDAHTGQDLDTLATMANQVASIIRLGEVYDAIGATLLGALSASVDPKDFATALTSLRESQPDQHGVIALAEAFSSLTHAGEDAVTFATKLLLDVAAFKKGVT